MSMTNNTYIKCLLFYFVKPFPLPPPHPPQILQIKQDKCKQESVFWSIGAVTLQCLCNNLGVSSACVLQTQMNTQHRARVRAQLLKFEKKTKQEPTPKPQADAGRPLPSFLRAVPEAGWFGRERNTKVCALHTHPPTWLPSSSPFPCLFAQRRRLFPVTSPPALQSLPLRIPRSQNAPPRWGTRRKREEGCWGRGDALSALVGTCPQSIRKRASFPPSFPSSLPSFLPVAGGGAPS